MDATSPIAHKVFLQRYVSPIGELLLGASDAGVCLVTFLAQSDAHLPTLPAVQQLNWPAEVGQHAYLTLCMQQLDAYFNRTIQAFDLPLHFIGTPFQKQVWQSLPHIPYGKTVTYLQQAISLKQKTAIRAIAAANGQNKMAIVIPCHRVIGSNGSLTGYAGGLDKKKWLLDFEQHAKGVQTQLF